MRKFVILLCGLLLASSPAGASSLPKFQIVTEDWVPYQFYEGSALRGIVVDLVVELLDRTGSTQTRKDIQLLPWARAYRYLQTRENTMLFSMTRSPEREALFRWVGPVFKNTTYLIAAKKRNIKISSPDDLQNYQFGTVIDDASEMFLLRLGLNVSQFHRNTRTQSNLKMLSLGRLDMIVSGWEAFVSDATKTGLDPNDYELVYTVDVSDVSIAFHRKTPDWIIDKFQQAFDDMKTEGVYERVFERYRKYVRDE